MTTGRCSACGEKIVVVTGVTVYHGTCDPHARIAKLESVLTRILAVEELVASSEFYVIRNHDALIQEARALLGRGTVKTSTVVHLKRAGP